MRNALLKFYTFITVLSMFSVISIASADTPMNKKEYFLVNSFTEKNGFSFGKGEHRGLAENYSAISIKNGLAGRSTVRGKKKLDKTYFKDILTDTGYIVTSPWRWDEKDWATASLLVGTTGAVYFLDDEVQERER